ncbi:hypothetical protein ACLF6K_35795 [Streptomyces xanthophaeus]|uniref:hypothetical protein n=1 Tax=Streptomyces xanthophaeus TaxID=67385 RepID=UPI00398FD84B
MPHAPAGPGTDHPLEPHIFDPTDMDDLPPSAAMDAIITTVHTHPITPDLDGFLIASEEVGLITRLVTRLTADTFHNAHHANASGADWGVIEAGIASCIPLARALAHYTQALAPLAKLSRPTADPAAPDSWLRLGWQRTVLAHGAQAHQALAEAHAALLPPNPPASMTVAGSHRAPVTKQIPSPEKRITKATSHRPHATLDEILAIGRTARRGQQGRISRRNIETAVRAKGLTLSRDRAKAAQQRLQAELDHTSSPNP